jgi:tetratricopeptide (TPR) repeat protein
MTCGMAQLRRLALLAVLAAPQCSAALEVGETLDDLPLATLAGGKGHLVEKGTVNVLVFVRPGHGHCLDVLRSLADRENKVSGVRWAAVVSGDSVLPDTRTQIAGTGINMPVLVDAGDVAYGRLGLKLHPTVVVLDRVGRLAAIEPFRKINYGDRVLGRARLVLGEISEKQFAEVVEPRRSETHSEKGMAKARLSYAQKLVANGQLDLAMAHVQAVLAIAPSAQAYQLRGKILALQGKCDEAHRALEVALKLEPDNTAVAAETSRCSQGKVRAP